MKRIIAFILCLVMAFSLCACKGDEPAPSTEPTAEPTPESSYAPVSFKNHGKRSPVTALPQKVVTAGPNCTEVFCALGLEDKVIGKCMENHSLGALTEYAEAVDSIPTLSVGYPTAQQIIDSGCDFLYASSWIFDDELTVAQLEKAGITVYVSEAETIEAVWQELRDLGKVFLLDNIEEIVSEQCTRLEAVTDKLGEVTEPKSVFVLDSVIGDKLYTAGGTNIESAYIAAAGGVNAMSELTKAWDAVEVSAVVAADPWCIVIHDYEGSSYDDKVAALKADPELSQLDCVKNERFVRLSLEDAMPGMRAVPTVEAIAQALYPDKF